MFGRSKELTNCRASSSARRSTISRRVGASAVAVSAMRGTSGQRSCSSVSWRYSGRKSWPHCETQCASSMANSAMRARSSSDRNRGVSSRSGATYSRSSSPREQLRSTDSARGRIQRRVEERRAHAELAQRLHLVLHQRDQRRDHDRRALAQQRRQLVAQRLAAAGGHEHQRVAAAGDVRDDLAPARRGRRRSRKRGGVVSSAASDMPLQDNKRGAAL